MSRPRTRPKTLLQWLFLGALVGVACGAGSALFLKLLEAATHYREGHEEIVYALPIAGLVMGLLSERWGKSIRGGSNLVIDTIHGASPKIPLRMAPMVMLGTVLTHLFGGSAGREGTAVQMGASLADEIAHRFALPSHARGQLLAAGIAGGFGSVFGTPVAGMVFGLEVVWVGRIEYPALLPALVAAVVGDSVTRHLGIVHTPYPVVAIEPLTALLAAKWLLFGLIVAGVSAGFVELTHAIKRALESRLSTLPLRMMVGGLGVVMLWKLFGTSDYLGLGVPTILRAFRDVSVPWYAFAAKLVFTAVTLGCGFLGGEVTPLFFIGATLGSVASRVLHIPLELAAGVGLAAVFAAAANTPLALSLMAVELMGAGVLPHVVVVCVVAYLVTGHRGIYPSQRLFRLKTGSITVTPAVALRDVSQFPSESPPPPVPPESTSQRRDSVE